jgi:hypothetical protein
MYDEVILLIVEMTLCAVLATVSSLAVLSDYNMCP